MIDLDEIRLWLGDVRVRLGLVLLLCIAVAAGFVLLSSSSEDPPTESEKVGNVVREFVLAGNERDFVVVCDLLSEQARGEIEHFASRLALEGDDACSKALQAQAGETVGNQTIEILDVRIAGERAAVDVATDDPEDGRTEQTVQLIRDSSDEWKISNGGG